MSGVDRSGGRPQPAPAAPQPLQLPTALKLPPALKIPGALQTPDAAPNNGRLQTPQALDTPQAGPSLRPTQQHLADAPVSGWAVVNTTVIHVPPTSVAAAAVTPEIGGGQPVLNAEASGASGADRPAACAEAESSADRHRFSSKYLLALLLIPLIGALDNNHHHTQHATTAAVPQSVPTGGVALISSVGMPIPGGNAPVEPVRIVIAASANALPLSEQRKLADWIATTQHERTRVRFERDNRVSAPLSAAGLQRPVTATQPLSVGATWLRSGARHRRYGARLAVGGAPHMQLTGVRLRSATIGVSDADHKTQNAVAAKLARQIMITSRQRDVGTTTP